MQAAVWAALAAVAVIVAVAAVTAFLRWAGRQHADTERLGGSLQQLLATTADHSRQLGQLTGQLGEVAGQLGQIAQSVLQQLDSVRTQLQQGLSQTGQITQGLQQAVGEQLRQLAEQLGALQAVLTGARTRGALGEVLLEQLLQDLLPAGSYQTQVRFQDGNIVDAVVRVEEKLIPIDSKFPLEAYRRMLENEQDEPARREFIRSVRKHADDIARKYIRPDERTMDFALMFVPSESVYYAMLTTRDNSGTLE